MKLFSNNDSVLNSSFNFVSSITKMSGKHFSIITRKSIILFLILFIFKKPISGLLGYVDLSLKKRSISFCFIISGSHSNWEPSVSGLSSFWPSEENKLWVRSEGAFSTSGCLRFKKVFEFSHVTVSVENSHWLFKKVIKFLLNRVLPFSFKWIPSFHKQFFQSSSTLSCVMIYYNSHYQGIRQEYLVQAYNRCH